MTIVAIPLYLFLLQSFPSRAEPPKFSSITGVVVNDLNGTPLRRAQVALIPRVAGLGDTVVETNDSGEFTIRDIEPGQYGLRAVRDGFLPAHFARNGSIRLPGVMRLNAGDAYKDVTFRMQPWAVIDGKVRYADNIEPALGVPVYLYRKVFNRGRQMYAIAGRSRTDDRGYFRIHGMEPGSYLLAAIYDRPIAKIKEDKPLDAPDREPSYASVFYPSGQRITDAIPIRLSAGQELTGLDMLVEKSESFRVTGTVTDACTGQMAPGANIEVSRVDDQGAPLAANADVQQAAGQYTIRGLTPGTYKVTATLAPSKGPKACATRSETRLLTVAAEPIGDFRLLLVEDVVTSISILVDGKPNASRLELRLEPKTPGRPILSPTQLRLRERGPIMLGAEMSPHEIYDIFIDRLPTVDAYLLPPYTATAGSPITIRLATDGAKVIGSVFDDNKKPISGAVVTMIPERNQPQLFREGYVDQNGLFMVQGLAPGRYIAVPWLDSPPCEFANPGDRQACEGKGKAITVKAGESSLLELDLKVN